MQRRKGATLNTQSYTHDKYAFMFHTLTHTHSQTQQQHREKCKRV